MLTCYFLWLQKLTTLFEQNRQSLMWCWWERTNGRKAIVVCPQNSTSWTSRISSLAGLWWFILWCLVTSCFLFQLHPEAPGGQSVLHVRGGPDGRGQSHGRDMWLHVSSVGWSCFMPTRRRRMQSHNVAPTNCGKIPLYFEILRSNFLFWFLLHYALHSIKVQ